MSIDNGKNNVLWLNNQLEAVKAKNQVLSKNFATLMSKVRFYKDLPVNTDYDKGFYKAFEIVEKLLTKDYQDS